MASIGQLYVDVALRATTFATGLREIQRDVRELDRAVRPITKLFSDVGAGMMSAGKVMSTAITVPLVAIATLSVKAASDFESAFAGVRKTVSATEPEFRKLSQGFREMALAIPVSVNELAKLGESAGQLGIKKENILDFVKTMATLSVTTNLTAEEASTAIAKIQNIFATGGAHVDRFASALVALGNSSASTEKDIVAMGVRIAKVGAIVGMSQADVLAFSSSMSSIGLEAEAGGSAMSRLLLKINDAVKGGGALLTKFAEVAGMSAADFKRAFGKDAAEATLLFIQGIDRMKHEGKNINGILEEVVGKQIILKTSILGASGAYKQFGEDLKTARDNWVNANAANDEARERFKTFESQLKLFNNALYDVRIELGTAFLPMLVSLLNTMKPLIAVAKDAATAFAELPQPIQVMAVALLGIVAATGPVVLGFGFMLSGVADFIKIGATFTPYIKDLIKHLGAIPAVAKLAATSIGWVGAAMRVAFAGTVVALIVATIYQIYELANAWRDMRDAQILADKDIRHSHAAVAKMAEELKVYGIFIEKGSMTTAEWLEKLVQARHEIIMQQEGHRQFRLALEDVIVSIDRMNGTLGPTEEEIAAFNAEVAKLTSVFGDQVKEANILNAALQTFEKQGIPKEAVIAKFGKQITDITEQLNLQKKAVPPLVAEWAKYIAAMGVHAVQASVDITHAFDNEAISLLTLHERLKNMRMSTVEADAQTAALDIIFSRLDESILLASHSAEEWQASIDAINKKPLAPTLGDGFISAGEAAEIASGKFRAAAEAAATALSKAKDDVHKSAGAIFDVMLKKGQSVFENLNTALKGGALSLGRTIFQDISAALLGPVKVALDDFIKGFLSSFTNGFKNVMSDIGESIGAALMKALKSTGMVSFFKSFAEKIAGIFKSGASSAGSAGISGAGAIGPQLPAGQKFGAWLGGLMSNPITLAVGIIVADIVAWGKSQAHHEASTFVREMQDPFANDKGTGAVNKLAQAFDEAMKAGTMTYEGAVAAKAAVQDLWTTFANETIAYSKRGQDEALVANQAFATLTPIITKIISDMNDGVNMLAADVETARRGQAEMEAAAIAAEEAIEALAKATDELNDAIARRIEIDEELIEVHEALSDALNSKVNGFEDAIRDASDAIDTARQSIAKLGDDIAESFRTIAEHMQSIADLDNDIQESFQAIDKLEASINEVNDDLSMLRSQLEDTAYWQEIYTEAVLDAERAYEDAVERRKDLEEKIADEIASIAFDMRKDELQTIIDTSASAKAVAQANVDMVALEKQRKQDEQQTRLQQLEKLKQELAEAIRLEDVARHAIAERQRETAKDIEEQKKAIRDSIKSKEEERAELYLRIKAEQDSIAKMRESQDELRRKIDLEYEAIEAMKDEQDALYLLIAAREASIVLLEEEKEKTLAFMDTLGVERQRENDKIDDTIKKLIERRDALLGERDAIDAVIASSQRRVDALTPTVPSATPAGAISPHPTQPPPSTEGALPPHARHPDQIINGVRLGMEEFDLTLGTFLQGAVQHQLQAAGLFGSSELPYVTRSILERVQSLGLPTYGQGTPYVPFDQIAMLHRGEAVIPEGMNQGFNLYVTVEGDGDAGKIRKVLRDEMPWLAHELTRQVRSSGQQVVASSTRGRR